MERFSRILLFVVLFSGLYFFMGGFGNKKDDIQPITRRSTVEEPLPPSGEVFCELQTKEFQAKVSSRGGVLKSFQALTPKYRVKGKPTELLTTPDHPELSALFVQFRNPATAQDPSDLVDADVLQFAVQSSSPSECVLVHDSPRHHIVKTIRTAKAPYTVDVELSVENRSQNGQRYALLASSMTYLKDSEVEGRMFSMNPRATHVECVTGGGDVKRERHEDFKPSAFEDTARFAKSPTNDGDWSEPRGAAHSVAVSSAYFTSALASLGGPADARCQLQIEDRWNAAAFGSKGKDPNAAALYKARFAYEPRILPAGASETYKFRSYIGPKERNALAAAGGQFVHLIDLGFFSVIAKVLVAYLLYLYSLVPNWGLAIVILTITARMLLFPLSVPSIRNMIHMRELKPEMDKLNERFKDDPQAKGLAQMELWKKHGVNPMKGCLPQLASMPVWFALYTTLQTAVELYNIPFLWFPDLSAPDPYYVLPFIIGSVYFVQQKMMPMQADPAQQKMMMYMMPGMFTLFMLFLPSGLGVYMFTNSLLGILQQQAVERHARRTLGARKEAVVRAG